MELLFFLIPFVAIILGSGKFVWNRFTDGRIEIDRVKYPTLFRLQRITQYTDYETHKVSMKQLESKIETDLKKQELETDKAVLKIIQDSANEHDDAVRSWEKDFKEITREEDERKEREAFLERKRLAELKWEEDQRKEREHAARVQAQIEEMKRKAREEKEAEQARRDLELALWTKNELARQQRENTLKIEETNRRLAARYMPSFVESDDDDFYSDQDMDSSYGTRHISVHAVNIRLRPKSSSKLTGRMVMYDRITVNGWTEGEELYGNNIWFNIADTQDRLGGYIWSGSVDNQSTSGLKRVDPPVVKKKPAPKAKKAIERRPAVDATPLFLSAEDML